MGPKNLDGGWVPGVGPDFGRGRELRVLSSGRDFKNF